MCVMITGVSSVKEALDAYGLGFSAFGLLVEQEQVDEGSFLSPRTATLIRKSLAAEIQRCKEMPCQVSSSNKRCMDRRMEDLCGSILVTHITDVPTISHLISMIGVSIVQLVGSISPEEILTLREKFPYLKIIKSLAVIDRSSIKVVRNYIEVVYAIELDTCDPVTKRVGGTGKIHDWNVSEIIVQEYGWRVPIILAGGLHAGNIEKAIQKVKPVGIDVSAGVKSGDVLDREKSEMFLSRARNCMWQMMV